MKKMRAAVALLMVTVLVLAMTGCSQKAALVGQWSYKESLWGVATETIYTFEKDGSGTVSTLLGVDLVISYTVQEDQLTINSSVFGVDSTEVYTFTVKGDTLTLVASDKTMQLTRVK